ncbi:SDR family oxidoreductase [Leucobacter sp. HY1908]
MNATNNVPGSTQSQAVPAVQAGQTAHALQTEQAAQGPCAVVTGGGSGIGRAVALELAQRGWRVAVLGRREEALAATVSLAAAGQIFAVRADVTSDADVRAAFARVYELFGRIDLLFNNAGVPGRGARIDEIDPDEWRRVIDVNLTGSFLCAAAAFRIMAAQVPRGGRILNNGSIAARCPRPHAAAYAVSKHAITGLTRSIALDGRAVGITAGQVDIGNAQTELLAGFATGGGALQPDGRLLVEPTFAPEHAARMIADVASLPATTAVPELVITAAGMPYDGRG